MPKWTFLSISDLHYAEPDRNYLDDPKELAAWDKAYREDIFKDVYPILERGGLRDLGLCFIAIAGDITSYGQQSGFDRFLQEALPKLQRLVSDNRAICVVPGNHDVTWGLDPQSRDYFDEKFSMFRRMVDAARITSCLLPRGELSENKERPDLFVYPPHGGPIYVDNDREVLVLNINSALRCGELNKQMYTDLKRWAASKAAAHKAPSAAVSKDQGAWSKVQGVLEDGKIPNEDADLRKYLIRDIAQVTQDQIVILGRALEDEKRKIGDEWFNYLRVAIVHHHLVHFPDQVAEHKSYEFLIDSSRVLQLLAEFDFDVVLTGHKHAPYELQHRVGTKEMFIVGGPTVGGYPADDAFRGIRLITFEANQFWRKLGTRDLSHKLGKTTLPDAVQNLKSTSKQIITPVDQIISRVVSRTGYSYKDIISSTIINSDGDAHRSIEFGELIIKHPCDRAQGHEMVLPYTSGYLDQFQVINHTPQTDVQRKGPGENELGPSVQEATACVKFRPPVSEHTSVSYDFRWIAVNSYALDKLQYDRKYEAATDALRYVEFTHVHPVDPVERLTILVRFPDGFDPAEPPRIRVVRVQETVNPRDLKEDDEVVQELNQHRALRYFKQFNIAALRIKAPSSKYSYGIEWKLPDPPDRSGFKYFATIRDACSSGECNTSKLMGQVLKLSRQVLLPSWRGELDANLMIFGLTDYPNHLSTVSFEKSRCLPDSLQDNEIVEKINVDIEPLAFGMGIAGRAFKVNRMRIYVAPESTARNTNQQREPDYYIPFKGLPKHKRLIAFPLHLPVAQYLFQGNDGIYQKREPYGVISIGSQSEVCPIDEVTLERKQYLGSFQHELNKLAASHILGWPMQP